MSEKGVDLLYCISQVAKVDWIDIFAYPGATSVAAQIKLNKQLTVTIGCLHVSPFQLLSSDTKSTVHMELNMCIMYKDLMSDRIQQHYIVLLYRVLIEYERKYQQELHNEI